MHGWRIKLPAGWSAILRVAGYPHISLLHQRLCALPLDFFKTLLLNVTAATEFALIAATAVTADQLRYSRWMFFLKH